MKPRLLLAAMALLVSALLSATTPASGAGVAGRSSDYGATLAQWVQQHRPDQTGCIVGSCYGPIVDSVSVEPEFSFIQTFRGRVVGYEEALRRGTPLLAAELVIAEQFPADVSMPNRVTVIRHDRYKHSCAVFDLYSKSLAREFGRKGPANQGDSIGVELATVDRNGSTSYDRDSIDLAIVSPVYLDSSINC
ncbi:MAG: hypothetical protein WB770_02295 [Acidimicrobiales bacterium]